MKVKGTVVEERVVNELLQQFHSIGLLPDFNSLEISSSDNQSEILTDTGYSYSIQTPEIYHILTDEKERIILYSFFSQYFNKKLDWGILSGVKPVKLYRKIERMGLDPGKILTNHFFLSPEKVKLLKEVNLRQKPFLDKFSKNNHISLYLGIPICPSKCAYCSFVSTILDKKRLLLTDYLNNLESEIIQTGELIKRNNLIVDSVYIGGGTPSVLNSQEADRLIKLLKNEVDFSSVKEFTFEAGRPDTTTAELLETLKINEVDRICLNPQTLNPETLLAINRKHTVDEIFEKYHLARDLGFKSINMDLIVGLNNESESMFLNTLEKTIALSPDNLTVHDLSIKRGSTLNELNGKVVSNQYKPEFFNYIQRRLKSNNYIPYYMYRQKYTIGNGENIGYSKPGKESLYNILMMAEEQTILGIGAGSSGKLYNKDLDRFNHVFTVKDIRTYNMRAQEIINRKINDYKNFFESEE